MLFVRLFSKIKSIFESVCSIIKMFTQNKDDRKRVEKALDISGFPSGKVSSTLCNKYGPEKYFLYTFTYYDNIVS